MNNTLLIGLVLALLPVISWLLQFHLSKKKNELHLFKKHYPTYLMDWIFIPFNLFWAYSIIFSLKIFVLAGFLSLLVNYASAKYYVKMHQKEKRPIHLFDLKTGKGSASGYVHGVFSVIQLFLVFTFILDKTLNIFTFINIGLLLLFLLSALFASKRIHGKVSKPDFVLFSVELIIILLKLIITGFY